MSSMMRAFTGPASPATRWVGRFFWSKFMHSSALATPSMALRTIYLEDIASSGFLAQLWGRWEVGHLSNLPTLWAGAVLAWEVVWWPLWLTRTTSVT